MATASSSVVLPSRLSPRIASVLAILFAALLLSWPALFNRYPLLYPDSISYLQDGLPIARAILRHTSVNAMRSEFYALGLLPFHWNLTPWPIVALNALLATYVLFLTIRSIVPHRTVGFFLAISAFLSLFTSASWYVSLPMPDILGPLLYLAIYLLVFAGETLSRVERIALSMLAVWAVTAHATHLMLAAGLCILLAVLWLLRWRPIASQGRAILSVAALVAIAAGAQVSVHAWLYGKPSLSGNRPPYLMARIVADGPGARYLEEHCAMLDWAICADVGHLPDNDDDFLWGDPGIWSNADRPTQQRLLAEEMPLVLATLRAYPRQQIDVSWSNFTHQLNDFGVNDFDNNDWMESALEGVFPGSHAYYARTLQARSVLPTNAFSTLQRWIVLSAALLLAALLPSLIRHRRSRLLGLVAIVVPTLVANAFVTAVLSSSDSRYQSRVIWLVPLAAALAVLDALPHLRPHALP